MSCPMGAHLTGTDIEGIVVVDFIANTNWRIGKDTVVGECFRRDKEKTSIIKQ